MAAAGQRVGVHVAIGVYDPHGRPVRPQSAGIGFFQGNVFGTVAAAGGQRVGVQLVAKEVGHPQRRPVLVPPQPLRRRVLGGQRNIFGGIAAAVGQFVGKHLGGESVSVRHVQCCRVRPHPARRRVGRVQRYRAAAGYGAGGEGARPAAQLSKAAGTVR